MASTHGVSSFEMESLQQEINRFESLIKQMAEMMNTVRKIDDLKIKKTIKEQLNHLEDYINDSPEWNLPVGISQIRMVVSGNENSYKDRLRLIQTLVKSNNGQDRDIKGDRKHYKKLLTTEGKAHMLLMRIEDSNPNEELSRWMDTLIYVYNTRDRHGLTKLIEYINQIHTYLNQSNTANEQNHPSIPVVLIGIIDSLETSSSSSPHSTRIIDEISIKKIIDEISQCSHYEVKATSTQQVEKLLIDVVAKYIKLKQNRRPSINFNDHSAGIIPSPSMSQSKQKRWSKRGKEPLGEFGSGRTIPEKEGYLYKRSGSLDKKKKKYAVLGQGQLTYFPSFQDYQNNTHGKAIYLQNVCVKVKSQSRSSISKNHNHAEPSGSGNTKIESKSSGESAIGALIMSNSKLLGGEDSLVYSSGSTTPVMTRKKKSKSNIKNADSFAAFDDDDGYTFTIVSSNEQSWQFEVKNLTERDEWITGIQEQIMQSLQSAPSRKNTLDDVNSEIAIVRTLRKVNGNFKCVDCRSENPDWASLNLGTLMCIECSGLHRNLGAHISRVRSLTLDSWPAINLSVMSAIGNHTANKVWEANFHNHTKIDSKSSREDKEKFIRAKYEQKLFLAPLPDSKTSLSTQLIKAVLKNDLQHFLHVLAYCTPDDINKKYKPNDSRTALHFSCAVANPVMAQLLIWNNIDTTLQDSHGYTANDYARAANSDECIEVLVSNDSSQETSTAKTLYLTKELFVTSNKERDRNHSSIV